MFASCVLLGLAAAVTTERIITYVKPWDPFRRTATDCEICDRNNCIYTLQPRCNYFVEASKLMVDDDGDGDNVDDVGDVDDIGNNKTQPESPRDDDKIDKMLFNLVDSALSTHHFKECIPFMSQYTDCTEENICTGCKYCNCNEQGRWTCSDKQKCSPGPKLTVDHRIIGLVIENLKKKEKAHERRFKRSAKNMNVIPKHNKGLTSYEDVSKWMFEVEPVSSEENRNGERDGLRYSTFNKTEFMGHRNVDEATTITIEPSTYLHTPMDTSYKSDKYVDLLEFNDILEGWTTTESYTKKRLQWNDISQTSNKRRSDEIHANNVDYVEYDPIRLIKRETSNLNLNESPVILQINTTSDNVTYETIITDALQGLNKITHEKQQELDELQNIQNNLLTVAKTYNISIDINSTIARDNFNKHHIAIYKLDTFEDCFAKVKQRICRTIEDVIKSDNMLNSSDFHRDIKFILSTIKKYMMRKDNNKVDTMENLFSSQENDQKPPGIDTNAVNEPFSPITSIGNILLEINKAPANPFHALSKHTRKILKRIVKQLYFDDFAVIDYIVHETYYDFDNYLENIGTKWKTLTQDVIQSDVFDTLYRMKSLHMTLKADIRKMEDMVTLLDFARNRRMTVANGPSIDKTILRIQNNLKLIDANVQRIMKLEKNKRLRQSSNVENDKPKNKRLRQSSNVEAAKKKTILQKLKKMFLGSKNEIKDMLRKRFPKSEIIKRITKKKNDQLEQQRILDYQETMKEWQEKLNVNSGREKRSAWGFNFIDRIKSIIPQYLRGKVKPAMQKKKGNKTKTTKTNEKKNRRRMQTKPTTTVTTENILYRSIERN